MAMNLLSMDMILLSMAINLLMFLCGEVTWNLGFVLFSCDIRYNLFHFISSLRVSDCYIMPSEKSFSYIMVRKQPSFLLDDNILNEDNMWSCFFNTASSRNRQPTGKHVVPLGNSMYQSYNN